LGMPESLRWVSGWLGWRRPASALQTIYAGSDPGILPADGPAPGRVSAPSVVSVAGAVVRPAVFALRLRYVGLAAGAPVPAAVAISGVPAPAWRKACSAGSGTSGRATHSRRLGQRDADAPEDLLRELLRLHSEDGAHCSPSYKARPPPWLPRLCGH
jgi:hypothetical protein